MFEGVFLPPDRVRAALNLLLESRAYSEDLHCSAWEFAVKMDELRALRLVDNDFAWLLRKGVIEHRIERVDGDGTAQLTRPSNFLELSAVSRFVLTEQGVELVRGRFDDGIHNGRPASAAHDFASLKMASNDAPGPFFDPLRQELRVGVVVVKRFKAPAINQQAVLAAFQEEQWPPRVDDPLPPRPDLDTKQRLHETIKSLNRNHKAPLLHFCGDGTGEGVRWEYAADVRRARLGARASM